MGVSSVFGFVIVESIMVWHVTRSAERQVRIDGPGYRFASSGLRCRFEHPVHSRSRALRQDHRSSRQAAWIVCVRIRFADPAHGSASATATGCPRCRACFTKNPETRSMKISSAIRTALVALSASPAPRSRALRTPMKVSCSSRSTRRDGSSAASRRRRAEFPRARYSLSTGGLDFGSCSAARRRFCAAGSATSSAVRCRRRLRCGGAGLAIGRGARAIV